MRAVLAVFLVLIVSLVMFPQEVIKEKVEIAPKLSKAQKLQDSFGQGSGSEMPIYINYGGVVKLEQILFHGGWVLYETNLGELDPFPKDSPLILGTFPQWTKFSFYMMNDQDGSITYPSIDGLSFDPSSPTGGPYPYNPEFYYWLSVDEDNSLAAMPPAEVLASRGNPFIPGKCFKTTVKGRAFAWIKRVNFTADDELWMQTPHSKMVGNNSTINQWDIIDLGDMAAGDSLVLYLRSSNTIVSGLNLFPRYYSTGDYITDGYVCSGQCDFEDWTDLYFDNLSIQILFQPDPTEYTGPIAVFMTPDSIAPGDTVSLSFKRKYLDGTFEDFFTDDHFEVGIQDGCVGGNLLYNGEEGAYFDWILQPIKFVASDNFDGDSAVVKIRVGVYDRSIPSKIALRNNNAKYSAYKEAIPSQKQYIQLPAADKYNLNGITIKDSALKVTSVQQLSKLAKKEVIRKTNLLIKSPVKTASETCFGGDFYQRTFATQDIVVINKSECKEKTIGCNSYDSQSLEQNSFVVVGENQAWNWTDKNGKLNTTSTGSGCQYNHQNDGVLFGITYPLLKIGDKSGSAEPLIYTFGDDITLSTCLDTRDINNRRWLLTIDNLRIPIFTSFCQEGPGKSGWIDLNDGTDNNLLARYANNVDEFNKVMKSLRWWYDGPYYNEKTNINIENKYFFNAGIIAHENIHVAQYGKLISGGMDTSIYGFNMFRTDQWMIRQSEYSCPEIVREKFKGAVRASLKGQITYFANIINEKESPDDIRPKSEYDADMEASERYLQIQTNIINWAQTQSWWDKNNPNCTQWLTSFLYLKRNK